MGVFAGSPSMVNSRGDTLSDHDKDLLYGPSYTRKFGGTGLSKTNPAKAGELLFNWLTAGGMPKPVEPGKLFKDRQDFAPAEEKAAAGSGFAGLFGIGLNIGGLAPGVPYSTPAVPKLIGGK